MNDDARKMWERSFEKSLFCKPDPSYDEDVENPKCPHGVRWSHFPDCEPCNTIRKSGKGNPWLDKEVPC